MSHRSYITTLTILVITYILILPIGFPSIPFFEELKNNYPISTFYVSITGGVLSWLPVLIYFKQRQWRFSFITGISSGTLGILLFFLAEFNSKYDQASLAIMGLASLLYLASLILYGISFLNASRTKGLKFIRVYGVMAFLSVAVLFLAPAISMLQLEVIAGIISTIQTGILILHFVYERNKLPDHLASEEILDADVV